MKKEEVTGPVGLSEAAAAQSSDTQSAIGSNEKPFFQQKYDGQYASSLCFPNKVGFEPYLMLMKKMRDMGQGENMVGFGMTAFAYLYQRFGPPMVASEPGKLAFYRFPTRLADIFLDVYISGDVEMFVTSTKEVAKDYLSWFAQDIDNWANNFRTWSLSVKHTLIYNMTEVQNANTNALLQKQLNRDVGEFYTNNGIEKGVRLTEEQEQAFWQSIEDRNMQLQNEYMQIERMPVPHKGDDIEDVFTWHRDKHLNTGYAPALNIYKAIEEVIEELSKPLFSLFTSGYSGQEGKGFYWNMFGMIDPAQFNDDEKVKTLDRVWYASNYGFFEPRIMNDADFKTFNLCLDLAEKKGDGDLVKGLSAKFEREISAINKQNAQKKNAEFWQKKSIKKPKK